MIDDIQLDFDAVKERIQDSISYIKSIRVDKQYKSLLGERFCEKLEKKEKELKKYIEAPFNIIVVGDFKRGKSSFINSLLGKELLPSDVSPETVTINMISYGEENLVEIYFENNTKKIISINDLKRENLEAIIKELPSKIKYISIKDNSEILKDLNFIDTPGLNDALDSFDEIVIEYLSKADAVIDVVSANFPMSLDEQNFLSKIIIPTSLAKNIVIVNMCDCLENNEDIKRIQEFTQKKCYEISPEIEVYAISSLEELCRFGNEQSLNSYTSDYLGNNYIYLKQAIQSELIYKSESLKATNCINHTKAFLREINSKCLSLKQLQLNQNENNNTILEEKINDIELQKHKIENILHDITNWFDSYQQEASLWMKQYLLRIRDEIQKVSNLDSSDQIEKNIKFYFSDMLKKGFETCINYHILQLTEKLQTDLKEITLDNSSFNTSSIDEDLDSSEILETFGISENLELANTLAECTFGVLPVATSILSIIQFFEGLVREKKKKSTKIKVKICEQLLSVYNTIELKTQESISFVYTKYKENVIEKIKQTYELERKEVVDSLEITKKMIENKTKDSELILNCLDEIIVGTEKQYKNISLY